MSQTTNRLGQMDDAFISRITVPIWYPELTKVSQKEIWSRFCRRYESYDDEDVKVRVDESAKDHVMELEENLNGREIRKGAFHVFRHSICFVASRPPQFLVGLQN